MSLKVIGKKVVSDMIEQAKSQNPWKVLVVDEYALKVLGSATRLFDLADEKISVVEKLRLKRKPLKDLEAIYVAAPVEDSVNKIIEDFEARTRLYAACHIFFITTLPDDLFQKMSGAPVAKFIKTFKELNYEFAACESQVFTTDFPPLAAPTTFTKLFAPAFAKERKKELARLGRQVATFCATLGEYPIVRYCNSSMNTPDGPFSKIVAGAVQDQIDQLYRLNPDAVANDKARAILLVLDRSFDLVTPLVHDFTYQAMANDLIEIEEGAKYTYQSTDASGKNVTKTSVLEEEDEKWRELRHRHIAECVAEIVEEFNKFVKANQALREANKTDAKGKSLKDVGALIRAAPQYTEQLSKFSLHLSLTQAAMSKYTNDKIEDLARFEQGLATKETAEGDPYKLPSADELASVLNAPGRTPYDKLRVFLLYIQFRGGMTREDRQALVEKFQLGDQDRDVLDSLGVLGIRPEIPSFVEPKKKKKDADGGYELSRYNPRLRKILEKLDEGELSVDDFPYYKEVPLDDDEDSRKRGVSMRTAKSNWAKGQKKDESASKAQKIIVFVAGGVTFSEMRCIYEVTSRDVYLGSDRTLTPKQFVDQLRTLSAKTA